MHKFDNLLYKSFGMEPRDESVETSFVDLQLSKNLHHVPSFDFSMAAMIYVGVEPDRSQTFDVIFADIDGDGDQDLIHGLKVSKNDGAGNFTDSGQFLVARYLDNLGTSWQGNSTISVGDVDGDGDVDVFVGSSRFNGSSRDALWLNDGTGYFTQDRRVEIAGDFFESQFGDVDGDGDLDLVLGRYGDANQVWLNDGTGRFSDSGQLLGNGNTTAIELGDVDGDGDLDMVSGNIAQPNRVWLNDGAGSFSDSGQEMGSRFTRGVTLGDIDGDGDLDLVTGNNGQQGPYIWINDGNGTFTDSGQFFIAAGARQTYDVDLVDLDGDGDLDLIVANAQDHANRTFLNDGAGVFTYSGVQFGTGDSESIATADIDGDGDLDIAIGNGFRQPDTIWRNDGVGGLSQDTLMPSQWAFDVQMGDLDGDGDLDSVYGNWSEIYSTVGRGNTVALNTGGVLTDTAQLLGEYRTDAVSLGDVDGDGDLDIATANFSEGNRIWLNDGSGNFSDSGQSMGTSKSQGIRLGDFNNDNHVDIIIANRDGQDNTVWLNDGFGVYSLGNALSLQENSWDVEIGDLDGDGDLDAIFANHQSSASVKKTNTVWLNDGAGNFTAMATPLGATSSLDLTLADFDGDGDLDYVDTGNEGSHLWLNDGAGGFSLSQTISSTIGRAIASGDFDGDGDIDIVISRYVAATLSVPTIWHNDGAGTFTDSGLVFGTGNAQGFSVADLDGDGVDDIITANYGLPSVTYSTGLNSDPVFHTPDQLMIGESQRIVGPIYVTDVDMAQSVGMTISGGADANLFTISTVVNPPSLENYYEHTLYFSSDVDFEMPGSAAGTNVYQVEITIDDGVGGIVTRLFSITVTDEDGPPIIGTLSNDNLVGTAEGETLQGLVGDDILNGEQGNDILEGGVGADQLNGGAGSDTASYATASSGVRAFLDSRVGDVGDAIGDVYTSIENLTGSDYIDNLYGNSDANIINGGSGNDNLYGGSGADTLNGGAGEDYLYVDADDVTSGFVDGGDGYDTLIAEDINGTGLLMLDAHLTEVERFFATNVADRIEAQSSTANLTIYGFAGADIILTGSGDDYIYFDHEDIAGGGIRANAGYDWLLNNSSSSFTGTITVDMGVMQVEGYYGGAGAEIIDASLQVSAVTIYANGGADQITGGAGGDVIYVTSETVSYAGGAGYDYIIYNSFDGSGLTIDLTATGFEGAVGRNGNDSFDASGNTVSASLYGAGGNDTLIGGSATDYFYGDAGNDTYTGNGGTDYFLHDNVFGNDTITDFVVGTDVMIVRTAGVASMANIVITQDGSDALLTMGANSIRLTGVTAATLTPADFIFAPTSAEALDDGPTVAANAEVKSDLIDPVMDDFAAPKTEDGLFDIDMAAMLRDAITIELPDGILPGQEGEAWVMDIYGTSLL